MTSRHHHYLSQCYLKGFTKGGSKKSKLTVVDLKEKKHFETIPRNIGGIRDFNRIEVDGLDPNAIEQSLSGFEGKVASALRNVEQDLNFEGDTKDLILNLIALFAVRSPEMREHWRKVQAELAEKIMGLSLATKERWTSQIKQMKESEIELNENVTYEDVKKFHESKKYTIEVSKEHHIRRELVGIKAILPCLEGRNWLLIRSTSDSGPFITTDNPVHLTWKEPEKIPHLYRNSPGFGLNGTQVYFPISKNLFLVGEFDGPKGIIDGTRELVSVLNSIMLLCVHKQLYTPKIGFHFRWEEGAILEGTQILKLISVQQVAQTARYMK